jgi:hypothetical protein
MSPLEVAMDMARQFCPCALEMVFKRLYSEYRFFDDKTLGTGLDAGTVRLCLDIIFHIKPTALTSHERKQHIQPDDFTTSCGINHPASRRNRKGRAMILTLVALCLCPGTLRSVSIHL